MRLAPARDESKLLELHGAKGALVESEPVLDFSNRADVAFLALSSPERAQLARAIGRLFRSSSELAQQEAYERIASGLPLRGELCKKLCRF